MALMDEPKLLLLDEPTAGMTVEETQRTAQLLRDLMRPHRHRGHRARHALRARARLSDARSCIRAGSSPRASFEAIERDETGPRRLSGAAIAMLPVSDIHAAYGSVPVLTGVDLALQEGEVLGLLGRNGVGKTHADARADRPAAADPRQRRPRRHGSHRPVAAPHRPPWRRASCRRVAASSPS